MEKVIKVMVLGGAGFIGRHAVDALLKLNYQVVIGSRHPKRIEKRLKETAQNCERRQVRFEQMPYAEQWRTALEDIDVVINCVGILRERRKETYEAVHLHAPMALAQACKQKNIRLIHVSALGLNHDHRSGFLRTKFKAEQLLGMSGADYCLVRPSLLDGRGGFGASWIRRLSHLPVHLLPSKAMGKIAVLDVEDLGEALAKLVEFPIATNARQDQREFDLGGLQLRDIATYMQAMRLDHAAEPARCIRIPAALARIGSHLCDLLHFSPFSFGHWELLQYDNIPRVNRLPELLGRNPRTVGAQQHISGIPVPVGIETRLTTP
ncbi:MAG: NAD(P)H-binding protein [Arenimonas sp.]